MRSMSPSSLGFLPQHKSERLILRTVHSEGHVVLFAHVTWVAQKIVQTRVPWVRFPSFRPFHSKCAPCNKISCTARKRFDMFS